MKVRAASVFVPGSEKAQDVDRLGFSQFQGGPLTPRPGRDEAVNAADAADQSQGFAAPQKDLESIGESRESAPRNAKYPQQGSDSDGRFYVRIRGVIG